MKKILKMVIMLAALLWFLPVAFAQDSEYNTHTNLAEVLFAPNPYGKREITAISAKADKATSAVKLYARGGAGKFYPTSAPTNGATVISVANTGNLLTTNDIVAYCYGNGGTNGAACYKTTVSANTATTITLATGIGQTGSTNDAIYELTQQYQLDVGTTALNLAGFLVFGTPGDSPIYGTLDANTSAVLSVTSKAQ